MDDPDSLSRLTEREKVCLRQWLRHKSAKEIAADLGISHHAVEKRLKMARTKLGTTSSLEAARILGKAEGYGPPVAQSTDLSPDVLPVHSTITRLTVLGVIVMIMVSALALGLHLQPVALSQTADAGPAGSAERQMSAPASVPNAGTEATLRRLIAGLASGSPDYDRLSPNFAEVVRRDLPMTHQLFTSLGELKSMTFLGRGAMGDDAYKLAFANGGLIMSVALDADGRMIGGIIQPVNQ